LWPPSQMVTSLSPLAFLNKSKIVGIDSIFYLL